MADYPKLEYTLRQVRSAGDALKGDLIWTPNTEQQIIEIFQIAHSWVNSHALPMNSMRREIASKIHVDQLEGITVARLKSMRSIRKKLKLQTNNLNQMQDLGGCRAILPGIEHVHKLAQRIKDQTKHEFHNEKDYIQDPKVGGYRCRHLIYKFKGTGESSVYDGRRIEIQIRTRLQHSWATTVEAVGLDQNSVTVRAHDKPLGGISSKNTAEVAESRGSPSVTTVYIEADKIEDLKKAYPNYFGDVQVFINNLKDVTHGKDAREYTMPPRRSAPKRPQEPIGDTTWLRPGSHRRWRDEPSPPSKPKGKQGRTGRRR